MFETQQEIIEFVYFKLKEQGRRSVKNIDNFDEPSSLYSKTCAYRGDDNTRCALGWLITDAQYDSSFEGSAAYMVIRWIKDPLWMKHEYFLPELQSAHDLIDDDHFTNELRENFYQLAMNNNLSVEFLDR